MIKRHSGWIAFTLLIFALVPTALSFYKGLPILPNQIEQRIPDNIDGMIGNSSQRKASRVLDNFRTKAVSYTHLRAHET